MWMGPPTSLLLARLHVKKIYRFCGIPIWSIEVEAYETESTEDEEEDSIVIIQAQVEQPSRPTPTFGFIDHKNNWWDE